jgi:hypothetical protein
MPAVTEVRRSWLPDAVGLAVIVAVLVYLWARTARLFPEVEFIDWITGPARATLQGNLEAIVTFRDDAFSRHVAITWSAISGRACGTSIVCLNTLAFAPVAGGALAFYALGRAARLTAAAAAAVVVVWLVSAPAFDVITWQATLHDRFAAMFVPVALLLVLLAVRHARTAVAAVAWAAALTVVTVLAANSKEPAWILAGLLALAPLLVARDRRQAVLAAAIVALPVAYVAVHAITHLTELAKDPVNTQHINSGSLAHNLPVLTRAALPGGLVALGVLAATAIAGLVLAVRARRTTPAAFDVARLAIWIGLGAAVAWMIPMRTQFASGFYMYMPLGLAALAFALSVRAGLLALPERRGALRHAGVAIGAALVAWCAGASALDRWAPHGDWLALDANFRAAKEQIAAVHAANPDATVRIHGAHFATYRFVTASRADRFWRFYGPVGPVDRGYAITAEAATCGGEGAVMILLDERMRFAGTCP